VYLLSWGRPVAGIHADYRPVLKKAIPNVVAVEGDASASLDLSGYFDDPDDDADPAISVSYISRPEVTSVAAGGNTLTIDFTGAGQSNVIVTALSEGLSASGRFVVGVRPEISGDYEVASFEESSLDPESYWNGSDETGGYTSGPAFFYNNYNPSWFSWTGWAYSDMSDVSTAGWMNQYSAFTGEDVDTNGSNYAVGFASPASGVIFNDGSAHEVAGVYVTNSTYAALSMLQGDDYAKKFGGEDGSDEDWLKLSVEGYKNGILLNTLDYLLADYSFSNSGDDYVIETWQWLPLNGLGKIDSLSFKMNSSDTGDWGMNTPAYFAIDRLTVSPDQSPVVAVPLDDISDVTGKTLTVDISAVFSDPDDDDAGMITSIKSNTDETVASATLDGGDLTINLLKEGNTTITLEALSNNKSVEDEMDVTVLPTGTTANELLSVMIYPNPSSGCFRVLCGAEKADFISVVDLTGRVVFSTNEHDSDAFIDISNEPAGVYLLKAGIQDQVVVKTIIIQ